MRRHRTAWTSIGLSVALAYSSAASAQAIESEEEEVEAQVGEAEAEPAEVAPAEAEPPESGPTPPQPGAVDAASEAPTCAARAREVAAAAVVRVRSGAEWGAGFVYGSPRVVVTSFGLVSLGQSITIVARDGTHVAARLIGRDESYDLAILEATEAVPGAQPLEPAPETSAMLGRPVVAIGHPFAGVAALLGERGEGLLRWSVSEGTIGAVNEAGIQADLALTEGHAGAPLLDCEGRVLGMIPGAGILAGNLGLAVRTARIDPVVESAQPGGDFLGNLRLRLGIGALLLIDEDGRVAGGGYLTLGATLFDRISWMNRVGLLYGGALDAAPDELSVERRLVRIESLIGYRFFIDIGGFTTLYIVPAAGATITHFDETRRSVHVVPGCTPSDTESCVEIVSTGVDGWRVRPAIGLTFLLGGNFEVAYTLEIDVEEPVETFHAVSVGFLF